MHNNVNDRFVRLALTILVALLPPVYAASAHSTTVVAISTGFGDHTCALTGIGGVKCWGANLNGQLGNPAFPNGSPTPVDVDGLTAGAVAVSAGASHACALTNTGGVKCWGFNGEGQLGDGTKVDSYTPVDVVGLGVGVKEVAAGYDHTCALMTQDGIKCWGSNGFGQFGNGTTVNSPTPVDGGLTAGVAAIAVGTFHTCGLSTGRVLKCWGLNLNGQLGSGSTAQIEDTPVVVLRLDNDVRSVTCGGLHTCALTADQAKCWGSNAYGQLGDGTTADRFTPVAVKGLGDDINHISAGGAHTCAITEDGGVKCWGWNFSGQLGNNTTINSTKPVVVYGLGGD